MVQRLPESVRTRKVAEAVVAPSAFLLAGAAASAAILAGAALPVAVVAGAAGWLARVAIAAGSGKKKPAADRIDPFALDEPWRLFMIDALQARDRFASAVRQAEEGPLRERLVTIASRISDGVSECWRIARYGNTMQDALQHMNSTEMEAELAQVEEDIRRGGAFERNTLEKTRNALLAQKAAHERLSKVWYQARDRLRVVNAQLDEAVARAIEVAARTEDDAALSPLSQDVDSLVHELEALRLGLEEAGGQVTSSA